MHHLHVMHIVECVCCLTYIRNQFLGEGETLTAIGGAEEIANRLWSIFHHKIRLVIIQPSKVVDGQNVGMLHGRDAACFLQKALLSLCTRLIEAQDLECKQATQRHRFAHLIDIAVGA